jgi:hypothetical protein
MWEFKGHPAYNQSSPTLLEHRKRSVVEAGAYKEKSLLIVRELDPMLAIDAV